MNNKWTVSERKKFLIALKQYGSNDINSLVKVMEFKSCSEIRYMIAKYKKEAYKSICSKKRRNTHLKAPLDNWLNLLKEISTAQYGGHLSKALKYIALFENHIVTEDINLKDCYQILADYTSGNPPKSLDEKTKNFLISCTSKLAEGSEINKNQKKVEFLEKFKPEEIDAVKSYSKKNSIASLVSDVELNILKVPVQLLSMSENDN